MGELVCFEKKDMGTEAQYIDSVIDATDLVEGVNFEIASIVVLNSECDAFSLGGFLGTKSNELLRGYSGFLDQAKALIKEHAREDEIDVIFSTPFSPRDNIAFYKIKEDIDIDLATELGLGVVIHKGEFMIYSPHLKDPMDVIYEMLRLKIYFQIMHPEKIDEHLKSSFEKNTNLFYTSMLMNNGSRNMERLEGILKNQVTKEDDRVESPQLSTVEKITSGDIIYILAFLNGRKIERHEALRFLKKVDGCVLDDVINSSGKAIYTASKDNFFGYVMSVSKYKKLLEGRGISSYQELDDYANQYVVEHYWLTDSY